VEDQEEDVVKDVAPTHRATKIATAEMSTTTADAEETAVADAGTTDAVVQQDDRPTRADMDTQPTTYAA
jgi:hypothetical protein